MDNRENKPPIQAQSSYHNTAYNNIDSTNKSGVVNPIFKDINSRLGYYINTVN
jgi:hypothetical protein